MDSSPIRRDRSTWVSGCSIGRPGSRGGSNPGELIRTIPLAPGQKERFSVKIQQRNKKLTRQIQDKTSTESTEESTTQTKDSSEIVEEAAKSNKWHLDTSATGSFNMGFFGVDATTSAGYAQESSRSSKDTKSRLSEAMQKTARISRRESRVQVSTEREETFESDRSSEIINPNQEIAVTCLYETVQQIYTVRTALEGIEPCSSSPSACRARGAQHQLDSSTRLDSQSCPARRVVPRNTPGSFDAAPRQFAAALSAQALGLDEVFRLSKVLDQGEIPPPAPRN